MVLVSDQDPEDFRGTARFAIRKTLGSGGMGVVYHAYDRVRGVDVALKTLRYLDAEAIYRLKKEFRALVDFSHPNLVGLMELISEGELWFFTMELVRGVTFLDWINAVGSPSDTVEISAATSVMVKEPFSIREDTHSTNTDREFDSEDDPLDSTDVSTTLRLTWAEPSTESGGFASAAPRPKIALPAPARTAGSSLRNAARLRAALKQLTEGLLALHAAGKLHRDIKPSNVLVTAAGRVVILDFGLVTELFPDTRASVTEHSLAGTVAYMAPETGSDDALTPAADWYSVGVMLYEALTGRLPFPGSGVDVLLRKQREDPAPASHVAPNVPTDLNALCMALLSRDPARRLTGEELLRRLGGTPRAVSSIVAPPGAPQRAPFIGRHRHLIALEAAFAATQRGYPVAVYVRGASGIGKTALVRRFLDELKAREAVVLSGKCYERETVPFKALDSLIDSLTRYLSKLERDQIAEVLPRGVRALARVFPVLLRIEAVERAPKLPAETPDQQELRRRAFRALREMLNRICEDRPVVLFIDDLQWGDVDSAAMLLDILRPPQAPPVLLIFSYRSDEEAESPVLQQMLQARAEHGADVRVLTVGALTGEEARDLALTLLHQNEADTDERTADRIAAESEGNPFFIDAMVRHSRRESRTAGQQPGPSGAPPDEISLDRVLQNRLARLTKPSRRLLEIVAVAGRPVSVDLVVLATSTGSSQEPAIVAALRSANLIRSHQGPTGDLIETFHDRIRETVLGQLPPDQVQERHRSLGLALETTQSTNIEALFYHFREAGDSERAARYAAQAGERAAETLAFDRAAKLYFVALELAPAASDQARQLRVRMADALANAGRGAEAASEYLIAAKQSQALEALELERRAAEQLLISGHVDRGLEVLRGVLRSMGFKIASSVRIAYVSRILRRGKLWRRGFEFKERTIAEIDPRDLMKIDVLWTAVIGLVLVDFVRGADFQTRHVISALELGEPYRIARALACEAFYVATGGGRGQWRTARLIEATNELAKKIDHPHAVGLAALAEGAATYFEGHWARARVLLERTEEILRDGCTGVTWEIMAARLFLHGCLFHLGQIKQLSQRVPLLIDEAELRGDLFTATIFRLGHSSAVWAAADNPERGLRQIDEAMERWSQQGYHVQHLLAVTGRGALHFYAGKFAEAYALFEREWPQLEAAYLLKTQTVRIESTYMRARAMLAMARESPKRRKMLLGAVERDASSLERESMRWSVPLASLLKADIAEQRGDVDSAKKLLEKAIASLGVTGMVLVGWAARLRLGTLMGGDEGGEMIANARAAFMEQNIRNPDRFANILVPISKLSR